MMFFLGGNFVSGLRTLKPQKPKNQKKLECVFMRQINFLFATFQSQDCHDDRSLYHQTTEQYR